MLILSAKKTNKNNLGFTIVELLIVIVVIAILAAITIVAYNGISNQTKESALKSDLRNAATQLGMAKAESGSYPAGSNTLQKSDSTTFQYSSTSDTFCLSALSSGLQNKTFHVTNDGSIEEGLCPGDVANPIRNGDYIQTATASNCSTARTMVIDARDSRTYWIQKLADGECWMLTNLAYAGGGVNTYGDVKTLQNGSGDTAGTYTEAKYYIHPSSNPTVNPSLPSTSTDGGSSSTQYGYYYNWCAAMGAQFSTSACMNATTPAASTTVSVCPANWRLPDGNFNGEFKALNTAVNGGLTNTDAGLISNWLAQRGGRWYNGSFIQNTYGNYWSGTPLSISSSAYYLNHSSAISSPNGGGFNKAGGLTVRCVLA